MKMDLFIAKQAVTASTDAKRQIWLRLSGIVLKETGTPMTMDLFIAKCLTVSTDAKRQTESSNVLTSQGINFTKIYYDPIY